VKENEKENISAFMGRCKMHKRVSFSFLLGPKTWPKVLLLSYPHKNTSFECFIKGRFTLLECNIQNAIENRIYLIHP
jgi:hypothetical protein